MPVIVQGLLIPSDRSGLSSRQSLGPKSNISIIKFPGPEDSIYDRPEIPTLPQSIGHIFPESFDALHG